MLHGPDTSIPHQSKPAKSASLGYDFALLGLKTRESSVETIRAAAQQTAARIHNVAGNNPGEEDQMLADLASSTYRLLDPRRRTRMHERIQLSIYSERDLELQRGSRKPLFDAWSDTSQPLDSSAALLRNGPGWSAGAPASSAEGAEPCACRLGVCGLSLLLVLSVVAAVAALGVL